MRLFKYQKIRRNSVALNAKILKSLGVEIIEKVGCLFSIYQDKVFMFDNDNDIGIINDYVNNEIILDGKRGYEIYIETASELSYEDVEFLNALKKSRTSFFIVEKTIPTENIIVLLDMLTNEKVEVMDINFSQSNSVGVMLFTRIIPIDDIYIFSGMALFVYDNIQPETVFRLFRRELKKIKVDDLEGRKYIAAYKVYKSYGRDSGFISI